MLDFAILGLLHDHPMHGYELRKMISSTLGPLRAISYGSLYPTLRRMQKSGWIFEESPGLDQPSETPALSRRRAKIVYALTADGKDRFAELLAEAGPDAFDDDGFSVHFAFFAQTDAAVRMRILEGRRRTVEERREGLRSGLARTRERLDSYTLELQRHGLESVDREVRWLNELIASENDNLATSPVGNQASSHHPTSNNHSPSTTPDNKE